MKCFAAALVAALLLAGTPARAQTEREVQFRVSRVSKPLRLTDIFWQRPDNRPPRPAIVNDRGDVFSLRLPVQGRHKIVFVYDIGTSRYLPPTWRVQVNLTMGVEDDNFELPLRLYRWTSCSNQAADAIQQYSRQDTEALLQAILEAQFLLAYQSDARCQNRDPFRNLDTVHRVLNDSRVKLRNIARYISFP